MSAGRKVVERNDCGSCHTTDGNNGVGPTWKGLAGAQVALEDGRTVVADDDYLRRSIEDPDADVVEGFSAVMPDISLTDAEVNAVIAYIKSLG